MKLNYYVRWFKLRPYHIALADPSSGYDIISYDENGKIKCIEVKTRKAKILVN